MQSCAFFLGYGYFITHQVILPPRLKVMPTTMVPTNPDGVDHTAILRTVPDPSYSVENEPPYPPCPLVYTATHCAHLCALCPGCVLCVVWVICVLSEQEVSARSNQMCRRITKGYHADSAGGDGGKEW